MTERDTEHATLLRFERCMIGPPGTPLFFDLSWHFKESETWLITGGNGSGKTALAAAVRRELDVSVLDPAGFYFPFSGTVATLSFEAQREIIFRERYLDNSDYTEGGVDIGTPAKRFIEESVSPGSESAARVRLETLVDTLGIRGLLDRGIKYLSTGEIRKVLLCRILLSEPDLLVFDEPFEGLDRATREFMSGLLRLLIADDKGPRIMILAASGDAIPAGVTHVLHLEDRDVRFSGTRAEYEESAFFSKTGKKTRRPATGMERNNLDRVLAESGRESLSAVPEGSPILVSMNNAVVSYDGKKVLDRFSWELRAGDHTLVRGPNGCGKTTLLNLITGDNPQVYANDVTVLGYKRGSGESIWDVKAGIGYVSYQFHLDYIYRCDSSLEEVLYSGFYDSIGLYRRPGWKEEQVIALWLEVMGLTQRRTEAFTGLSYGEQRAALIARAMTKLPPLLILDEPCHGLDDSHTADVLAIADYVGASTQTTIIYVTHDTGEYLPCTQTVIEFEAAGEPGAFSWRFLPAGHAGGAGPG